MHTSVCRVGACRLPPPARQNGQAVHRAVQGDPQHTGADGVPGAAATQPDRCVCAGGWISQASWSRLCVPVLVGCCTTANPPGHTPREVAPGSLVVRDRQVFAAGHFGCCEHIKGPAHCVCSPAPYNGGVSLCKRGLLAVGGSTLCPWRLLCKLLVGPQSAGLVGRGVLQCDCGGAFSPQHC